MTRFDIFLKEITVQQLAKRHVYSGEAYWGSRFEYFLSDVTLDASINIFVAIAAWYDQLDLA